jgi:hypothetical protein
MTATIAELFKEYMAKMPDTFDTKKEIDLYFKDGLNSIVMERKAAAKADKTAKAAKATEKFIEKAKKEENAAKEAQEKAKKPKKEIDEAKAAEKAAEKAKKAAEKAAEKDAEKAKKASAANAANAERKIFNDEMRIRIKEMFPDLNSKRTKIRIDELWKIRQDRM